MTPDSTPAFDDEYDFVVIGSGGGGMAAALTAAHEGASTVVVEKAASFGGSTGLSGGAIWVPNNPELRRRGHNDSRESILRYLELLTDGEVPRERLEAYVDYGPDAMALLERSPWLAFLWVEGYSDYHPEFEGGRPEGRSVEVPPFDTRKLGALENDLGPNLLVGPMGLWITSKDYHHMAMVTRTWKGRSMIAVSMWRVLSNLFRRRRMATGGRALVARMRLALRDAGVPLWLNSPMTGLIQDTTGRVTGVTIERDGRPLRIGAWRGVLLATGGFEHNAEMRDTYLPDGGQANHSLGAPSNTGDGINAGIELGAAIDFMDDAWWMPSVERPGGSTIPLVSERAIPRQLIVSSDGNRFTNEAAPYVNFVHDQLEGKHLPAWCIMDARTRTRYPFAQIMPGGKIPQPFYDAGIVHRAGTMSELARKIGVNAENLSASVARFNTFAAQGKDEDFSRGDSAYEHYYGDPTLPNPNLDPVGKAPFYAFRIEVGDLGTKGGLVCDEHARVLREDGARIDGLYATGNTSASVMGREYAGPGATIGPSIVFGYLAVLHALGQR
ncbi:FAD-binding protein [Hoyosella sp. YIM 151337]|uniref:FAD-binding protein n=1 Tax=Hoyosella sp. YIM 151337 TaxID=2992742 RepID=UPI002236B876|nr:FAD-binding protein [Hoyosella sp. YIM 151337]MCW4355691.1 FAD-binding protein [Hoyosella sp. YIM 151337]